MYSSTDLTRCLGEVGQDAIEVSCITKIAAMSEQHAVNEFADGLGMILDGCCFKKKF